jgi:SPP1 gp7 family putative phage head morphogenesis protein
MRLMLMRREAAEKAGAPGADFWEAERQLLFNILFPLVLDAARTGAERAIEALLTEVAVGVDWTLVNKAVYDWARAYTFDLVRRITDTSRDFLNTAFADWVQSGAPLDDLIAVLEPMFGALRAEMIAITEVTRAFAEGNIAAWRASGVVDQMRWQTANDDLVCVICEPLNQQRDDLDGDFNGDGPPPAHVRCRCWLTPVVKTSG